MSSYVAAFDGVTCCNCGLPAAAHLAVYNAQGFLLRLPCPPAEEPQASLGTTSVSWASAPGPQGADLAHELLALVERERWWVEDMLLGTGRCRACGYEEGLGHHLACRFGLLRRQIAGLR